MLRTQNAQALSGAVVYPDPETLAHALANDLAKHIRSVVALSGVCHCVFPGGGSPHRMLELLRDCHVPWKALHLYPSDERCVPLGDQNRNDRLIKELLLGQVPLPLANLHSIPGELGHEEGAAQFSRLLSQTPPFDIALLGVGPDGHIASLFPGHPALADERLAVPVRNAPKPPPNRVSIGLKALLAARWRLVIATGPEKRELIGRIRRGADLPVTRVEPMNWYLDAAVEIPNDNVHRRPD